MKSVYFTKPKAVTLACLEFLISQGEELLCVVLFHKEQYRDTDFFRYCQEHDIQICDYSQAGQFFEEHGDAVEMIYCNTFPMKIKGEWIRSAKIAAINFHSSPLPEYQGVFGYNFAFLNHETEFGVTCHYLTEAFDAGNLIECLRFPFDFERGTVKELVRRADEYLLELFQKTYRRFCGGEAIAGIPQGKGTHYYSRQDFEQEKRIRREDTPEKALDRIRAFWYPPYEGAYVLIDGQKFFLVPETDYPALMEHAQHK